MAKLVKQRLTIFGDWAYIDGHWVYLPLWDPAPIEKQFRGYKQLFLANAISEISAQVANKDVAAKLNGMTKELISGVSRSGLASWEDGDGICPDWWPFPWPGPHRFGDERITPVVFPANLSKSVTNQIAGQLLYNLGAQTKMPDLQEMGKQIMG
jgi:hypothetical protein